MMKESTPEQETGMGAWIQWMNTHKAAIVDGARRWEKRSASTSAGAAAAKDEMGGYSIVPAESHEAATKMFDKDFPHLKMPGAWIDVVEIMPISGM